MKTSILVLGSSGLVGSRFTDLYHSQNPFFTPDSKELDISDKNQVETFFKENKDSFETVLNFAAYTDVDGAEKERGNEKGLVWMLNVDGPRYLAEMCQKYGKYFIQISTDFVFPGTEDYPGPYSEDAKTPQGPEKLSWYGWTKLMGEKKAQEAARTCAIVRISYPFRANYTQKLDFARNILTLFDEGKLYPMFSDQKMTPTWVDEACKVLYLLLEEKKTGIFHVATQGVTTPYEFASYLLGKARGVKGIVKEGSIAEFLKAPGRTPKPRLGGLESIKTQKILDTKFLTWKEAIDELVKQLK